MTQWSFDIDLLYKLKKKEFLVIEYPTLWSDKEYSKLNFFKAGPRMVFSIFYLRFLESPLVVFKTILKPIFKIGDRVFNK